MKSKLKMMKPRRPSDSGELSGEPGERHLQFLLSHGPGIIYALDVPDFTVTFISRNVADLLGYEAEEILVSGFWLAHVHPDDLTLVDRAFTALRAEGRHTYEYRFLHDDGTYHWMYDEMRLMPGSGGQPAEIFGVWLDVTQRRRAEEELRQAREETELAHRAKSELLAHMSHELRTPLSSILGFSELLADGSCGAVSDRQAQFLENILTSGHDLLGLINDLLDLVEIEAGRATLELADVDVGPLLADILDASQAMAVKAGLRLDHRLEHLLPMVRVEPRRFKQMLLNLLSNAIKLTPRGGTIAVHVRRRQTIRPGGGGAEMPGPWLAIAVTDSGPGIAAAAQPGVGLGLALTERLARSHGGLVWAESAGPGHGSTFVLALPVCSGGEDPVS